ncbi:MAG: hypothetical protein LBU70_08305 [Chitinispirillales bacterium]|nr:hypothetical protein [Chitinispirillales bacterium]
MSADKQNIQELIALIERNKYARGDTWVNKPDNAKEVESDDDDDDDNDDEYEDDDDYSKVRLLIFATEGPFTESLFPMLDHYEFDYAVTDVPEKAIDIVMNNPHIRHVMIDLDRPTSPAKGTNIFADLRTLNPGIVIYYCTNKPMTMDSRNLQTKGAKLLQKPILRKTLELFVLENFQH